MLLLHQLRCLLSTPLLDITTRTGDVRAKTCAYLTGYKDWLASCAVLSANKFHSLYQEVMQRLVHLWVDKWS